MKSALIATVTLALLSVPASAHQRHHHYRHYARHQLNPVVEGLGMGLAVMLRRAEESRQEGTGWPNVADVPPNGWPFQPYQNPVQRAVGRLARGAGLPGPCRQAARMGGPCGCWAEYTLFGRLEHVVHGVNMWLAADWLRFRRVSSVGEANAAVYLSRRGHAYHVAPIVAGVAHDYFGNHSVGGRVVLVRATI